jgi:hypothetical protein
MILFVIREPANGSGPPPYAVFDEDGEILFESATNNQLLAWLIEHGVSPTASWAIRRLRPDDWLCLDASDPTV